MSGRLRQHAPHPVHEKANGGGGAPSRGNAMSSLRRAATADVSEGSAEGHRRGEVDHARSSARTSAGVDAVERRFKKARAAIEAREAPVRGGRGAVLRPPRVSRLEL